jgi:ABC-2 type transport system permease protein
MNSAFLNLVLMQFKEFIREPETLFWSLIFPIGLSGVLGLAFSRQGELVSNVAVIDNQYRPDHAQLEVLLTAEPDSILANPFAYQPMPEAEAFTALRRGEISVIIEPRANNQLTYHFDPDSETAKVQYLTLNQRLNQAALPQPDIRPVRTRGSRYIDFLVPGLIALGLMNSCIWGIGWNLIEWRIKKLLRRMVASPMKKANFLLAQFTSRLALTLTESSCVWLFAYLFFDFRLQGNFITALLIILAGNVAFGGIAILVASRPQKTQVGSGVVNMVTLSMMILSGVFFSYTNFPAAVAGIIRFLPLTLLADSLRAVFNEGASILEVAGLFPGWPAGI